MARFRSARNREPAADGSSDGGLGWPADFDPDALLAAAVRSPARSEAEQEAILAAELESREWEDDRRAGPGAPRTPDPDGEHPPVQLVKERQGSLRMRAPLGALSACLLARTRSAPPSGPSAAPRSASAGLLMGNT